MVTTPSVPGPRMAGKVAEVEVRDDVAGGDGEEELLAVRILIVVHVDAARHPLHLFDQRQVERIALTPTVHRGQDAIVSEPEHG
jgi:hypothetical protein